MSTAFTPETLARKAAEQQRLAARLKANIGRRKQQNRNRTGGPDAPAPDLSAPDLAAPVRPAQNIPAPKMPAQKVDDAS